MCEPYFDGEVADVWVETVRLSRKEHNCSACGCVIGERTTYTDIRIIYDGSAWMERVCFGCSAASKAFAKEHGSQPSPSGLLVELEECARGDPRSWVKYAPMADAMIARGKQ